MLLIDVDLVSQRLPPTQLGGQDIRGRKLAPKSGPTHMAPTMGATLVVSFWWPESGPETSDRVPPPRAKPTTTNAKAQTGHVSQEGGVARFSGGQVGQPGVFHLDRSMSRHPSHGGIVSLAVAWPGTPADLTRNWV